MKLAQELDLLMAFALTERKLVLVHTKGSPISFLVSIIFCENLGYVYQSYSVLNKSVDKKMFIFITTNLFCC